MADRDRIEPVAKVSNYMTGGNAAGAWRAVPVEDYESLPVMRNGALLYSENDVIALRTQLAAKDAEVARLGEAAQVAVLALAHAEECSPGLYTSAYEKVSAALKGEG